MNDNTTLTKTIKRRYNRLARFYDAMEAPLERLRFRAWRSRFREGISGPKALEVGVGTGKNMGHYPEGVSVTAIDNSRSMLQRATRRAVTSQARVDLLAGDAQRLPFSDETFDTVFSAFVFCSVPDPVQGLKELRRVVKPDGRLLLLEHMRPGNPALARVFDILNPLTVRLTGANVNRRTLENVQRAGWSIVVEERLSSDIVRWIEARP